VILSHRLDADEAREVARDIRIFLPPNVASWVFRPSRRRPAYQCWKLARQKTDLQDRSRLIAKGLRFAHTQTARQQIEQLLVDFTVASASGSQLPFYRLESEGGIAALYQWSVRWLTPVDLKLSL